MGWPSGPLCTMPRMSANEEPLPAATAAVGKKSVLCLSSQYRKPVTWGLLTRLRFRHGLSRICLAAETLVELFLRTLCEIGFSTTSVTFLRFMTLEAERRCCARSLLILACRLRQRMGGRHHENAWSFGQHNALIATETGKWSEVVELRGWRGWRARLSR